MLVFDPVSISSGSISVRKIQIFCAHIFLYSVRGVGYKALTLPTDMSQHGSPSRGANDPNLPLGGQFPQNVGGQQVNNPPFNAQQQFDINSVNSMFDQFLQLHNANIQQQQQQQQTNRHQTSTRPKAIHCKTFKLGENFPSFITHFTECIKATYGFSLPTDQTAFEEACKTWLPSKLEPGPTLSAYESLTDAQKATWADVVDALKECFADETEKEMFLNDPAFFRRGAKILIEYKTELLRLMNSYLPDLKRGSSTEFQRQATSRFIEGLDDEELRRKLRRHCKRERNNVDEAYQYVVDWEASNVQTRIHEKEGAASISIMTRPSNNVIASYSRPSYSAPAAVGSATATTAELAQIRNEIKDVMSKQTVMALNIQENKAKQTNNADKNDTLQKEMTKLTDRVSKLEKKVEEGFARIEKLLTQNGAQEPFDPYDLEQG